MMTNDFNVKNMQLLELLKNNIRDDRLWENYVMKLILF